MSSHALYQRKHYVLYAATPWNIFKNRLVKIQDFILYKVSRIHCRCWSVRFIHRVIKMFIYQNKQRVAAWPHSNAVQHFFFFHSNSSFLPSYQYATKSATNKQCAPADPVITVNKFNTWMCCCTYANQIHKSSLALSLSPSHSLFLLCVPSPFLGC